MPSAWAQLPSGLSSSDLPPLLYKSEFNSTGYSIFITDLDFIWTESLDRRQIFKRALNENTSIDPSEDPSQMKILLQKIQAALRGDAGTSLSLSLPEGQRLLILTITAPLPAPLSPLEWIMRLELHPQDALREELILPLLNAQVTLSQRAESLIGMIREKDHVIARLVDKLEASGTDLASLFPGAAGLMSRNKGSSREVIAKVVRGLGEFDEEEWNAQLKGNTNSLRDVSFVVDTSTLEGLVEKLEKSRRTSTWWDHFGQKRLDINLEEATARAQPTKGSHSKISASENIEDSKDSDDEFQRQRTPPSLQHREKPIVPQVEMTVKKAETMKANADDSDETTDEDNNHKVPTSVRDAYKLTKEPAIGDETHAAEIPEANIEQPPPQPKKRLGTLGGRKQATTAQSLAERSDTPSSPAKSSRGKLGAIAGRGRAFSKQQSLSPDKGQGVDEKRNKDAMEERKIPIDEESEENPQERANRRREQLRRELEEKSKAPPKKKRRF